MSSEYYIVNKRILPDYFGKVIEARELIRSGKARDVSQAVKMVGISRSTYYKYKDDVYLPSEGESGKKAVISMILHHRPGILEKALGVLAENGANVLTISQTPPIQDRASVIISLDFSELSCGVTTLLDLLAAHPGVENPRLIDMA